jgi:hypothetical protein
MRASSDVTFPDERSRLSVSARTGIPSDDVQKRVSDTLTEARQAANSLRRATAHLLLWIFLALLIGAFSASFAATIGGRQRDQVRMAR